jgi:lipid-binding SYLF domain-containing protein
MRLFRRLAIPSLVLAALLASPLPAQEPAKEAAAPAPTPVDPWQQMRFDAKRKEIDATAGETLERLMIRNPKAKELYEKVYGYAVFDSFKFGIGLSGAGGSGVAVEKVSGRRIYMKMGSAGLGLTLGGQRYKVVFLMQDSETFDRFVTKGWFADASARAAAGPEGGASGTAFVNGLAVFQLNSGGLMASVDISSTWYMRDTDLSP